MDLSAMQKYRFIQYLIIFSISFCLNVTAQPQKWYKLYKDNDLLKLEQSWKSGKINNTDWNTFLGYIFTEKFEDILPSIIQLYDRTTDKFLKRAILDRLSQYYYSKGFYDTANRILHDVQFRNQIFSIKKKKIQFGVQLGAFSSYENALKSKQNLSKKLNDIFIISRNRNGRKFYLVVAGKFNSKSEAIQYKNNIYNTIKKKGIIIQY